MRDFQSTSVSPDEIPGLLPLKKTAPKKTRVRHITQVCGSVGAKEIMSKVQVMKDQKEKEGKRKKNAQKKGNMKAAFLHCKDKCVCESKRKCAATGLKMCEAMPFILHVAKQHAKLMGKGL